MMGGSIIDIVCGLQILGVVTYLLSPEFFGYLILNPALVVRGQIWRIVTFLAYPPAVTGGDAISFVIFNAIGIYCVRLFGLLVEQVWGRFKFNCYIISGVLLHAAVSVLIYLITGMPLPLFPNYLVYSFFFVFALMFPDMQGLFMMLIPLKSSWIAVFEGVMYIYSFVRGSLISRFYDVTCGTVKLNGRNVKELTNQEIHDKVGIVQQRSVLFKGSIRDNMKWGNENASDSEIWDALKVAQAKEVVERKDGQLDFMLEQNGKNLSGGQRQRLTIARALVKKPEILILDDSLSALDFATDAALRKALAGLEGETTTFLVSQRVAGIRQADKILVLDNGELAGSGTHDELMKSCEVYREIYFSQFPEDRAKYERGEM